ncbi:MAG TPA: Spy/CpxP family protein refolding chaperone [Gemmatimonadaceae bacterium]|nr:Spy/CpxP family protein refolding chaperone [Gemmatimonadaceae bacterium]
MRKQFVAGLGLALSLAVVAGAQQPADSAHRERGDRGGKFEGRRGGPGGGPMGFLLKDVNLTDAQKAQLKTMREADRKQFDATRDARKQQFEQARALREKGDTAGARALMEKNRQAMQVQRDQEIGKVRNLLTAEQRVQFDKNVAEMKQRDAQRGARIGREGGRGRRGGREKSGESR